MGIEWFNGVVAPQLNASKQSALPKQFPQLSNINVFNRNIPNVNDTFIMAGANFPGLITAVHYNQGRILYCPQNDNELAISFEFTGCIMARFCCNEQYYIAHIYLESGHDTRQHWNEFISNAAVDPNNVYNDFVLFRPYTLFQSDVHYELVKQNSDNISPCVCGIIENEQCYSCIMNRHNCRLLNCIHINNIQHLNGVLTIANHEEVMIQ